MKIAGAVLLAVASQPLLACPGLSLVDAWVRAAPPGATVMAAYGTLRNHGGGVVTVEGVSSPLFEAAMIHETVIENGITRMRHTGALTLAPGATLPLAPGGRHVMLMRPLRPLRPGEAVPLRLECGPDNQSFNVQVKEPPA